MDEALLNDKLELAKLYFKAGDFARALELYDQLVKLASRYTADDINKVRAAYNIAYPVIGRSIHPKLTSILDQRAATHEKLGSVAASIRDCELALKLDPSSLKAYLRLGKNHLRNKNHLKAYEVFQNGLYFIKSFRKKYPQVPINAAYLTKLECDYSAVNAYLKRQRSVHSDSEPKPKRRKKALDPFVFLSYDILEAVFSQLSVGEILKCHLVCSSWYHTLTSIPNLYSDVCIRQKVNMRQFSRCIQFLRKFSKLKLNLALSSTETEKDLWRITESIIQGNYNLNRIELINPRFDIATFISKLDKYNFKLKLQHLHTFKFISRNFTEVETILFNLCPNIKCLEVVLTAEGQKLPLMKNKTIVKHLSRQVESPLETLTLINRSATAIYPPLITKRLHALSTLIVAGFNFNNIQHIFGQFVADLSLKTLVLENNRNFSFKQFLLNLINYQPEFALEKLVFREYAVDKPLSMNEFANNDFACLKSLAYLDIYSSSLTNKGLLKLLETVNAEMQLETLILGYSNYIYFKNDQINNLVKISLYDVLRLTPGLIKLVLVNLNIDDLSLKLFNQDLKKLSTSKLKYLDLSFNLNITGFGLINLFDSNPINLHRLTVNGVDVNKSTVNHIQKKYDTTIENDHMRVSWRQYGVNSYVPDIRD